MTATGGEVEGRSVMAVRVRSIDVSCLFLYQVSHLCVSMFVVCVCVCVCVCVYVYVCVCVCVARTAHRQGGQHATEAVLRGKKQDRGPIA